MISRTAHGRRRRGAIGAVGALVLASAMGAMTVAPASADELPEASASASASKTAADLAMTPELAARIQTLVNDFSSNRDNTGVSVAVVTPDPGKPGAVTTTFTAGLADRDPSISVDTSTQFELGSESKAFTADLLASLVAAGRVSLDDSIAQYAPSWVTLPAPGGTSGTGTWADITLGDLATHQSGLPRLPSNLPNGCDPTPTVDRPCQGYTQTELWEAVQGQTPIWTPGTHWLYSNFGFGLLGTILANVVQSVPESDPPAYQSALDGAFLDELGMKSTELEPADAETDARIAVPYAGPSPTFYWHNTNAVAGGGGLVSDAKDMGTWVAAHLGYLPDVPASTALKSTLDLASPVEFECNPATDAAPAAGDDPASGYDCQPVTDGSFSMGLGWQLYTAASNGLGAPSAFKDGGTGGSSSDTLLMPTLGVGVTSMFNRERENQEQITRPVMELVLNHRAAPLPDPTPRPDAAALAATGTDLAGPGLAAPVAAALAFLLAGAVLFSRRNAIRRRPGPGPGSR